MLWQSSTGSALSSGIDLTEGLFVSAQSYKVGTMTLKRAWQSQVGKDLAFRWHRTDGDGALRVVLTVGDGADFTALPRFQSDVRNTTEHPVGTWIDVAVSAAEWTAVGGASESDLANVTTLWLVVVTPNGTPTVKVADIVTPDTPEPSIIWVFDDDRVNTYDTAWPILAAHGFLPCRAISTNLLGPSTTTLAQLEEMRAADCEIVAHGHNHLSMNDNDNVAPEIAGVLQFQADNPAFVDLTACYAYPSGAYSDFAAAAVLTAGFVTARTTNDSIAWVPGRGNRPRLGTNYVQSSWTVADVQARMDKIAARGGVGVFTFHSLDDPPTESFNWYVDRFETVAAYAESLGLAQARIADLF